MGVLTSPFVGGLILAVLCYCFWKVTCVCCLFLSRRVVGCVRVLVTTASIKAQL